MRRGRHPKRQHIFIGLWGLCVFDTTQSIFKFIKQTLYVSQKIRMMITIEAMKIIKV